MSKFYSKKATDTLNKKLKQKKTVCSQVLNKLHCYILSTGFHEHNNIEHVYNMTKKSNTSLRCGIPMSSVRTGTQSEFNNWM